jgi:Outer membrane protein beta-barrel domain
MRRYAIMAALLLAAAPLAGQGREVVLSLYGGGADHLADLQESPQAWFMPGYALGGSVGVQLNNKWGIHGDFTYTRNSVDGSGPMAGGDVNRFYYGAHAEYRFLTGKWNPFLFAGLGAVSIDQLNPEAFDPTTRPAALFGGGMFYQIPSSKLELLGEIKGLTYNWNMSGFDRNMLDVTYVLGLAYRFGL